MATLAEVLAVRTVQAAPELVEPIDRGRLRCHACGHACPIPDGAAGVCKVRFNRGGVLHVPYGYVGGVQCDPIEKKPFFHAHPGALAFSFGMLGCDLHCSVLPELGHLAGAPRSASGGAAAGHLACHARRRRVTSRRAGRRQHLQRAVDHERVGGRDLQGRPRARADDRVCLER